MPKKLERMSTLSTTHKQHIVTKRREHRPPVLVCQKWSSEAPV